MSGKDLSPEKVRIVEKQLNLRTIHAVCFIYLLGNVALSLTISFPEIFRSFLSLPTFLLLPYMFGQTTLTVLDVLRIRPRRVAFPTDFVSRFTLLWFLGIYSLIMIAVSAHLLGLSFVLTHLHFFALLGIFAGLPYIKREIKLRITFRGLVWLTMCFVIAIAFVLIAKNLTPFPYVGVDGQRLVLIYQPAIRLIEDGYLTPDLRIPEYLITAIVSMIHGIDPLSFLWSSSFVLTSVYVTGVYYLANTIFQNKYFSMVAATMSICIFVGYPFLFSDTPVSFFRTSTILLVFYPFILEIYHKSIWSKSFSLKQCREVLMACIAPVAIYYLVGTGIPFEYLHIALPLVILGLPLMGFVVSSVISMVWRETSFFDMSYLFFMNFLIFHNYEALLYIASILIYLLAYFVIHLKLVINSGKVKLRLGLRFISFVLMALCLLFFGLQYIGILRFDNTSMISGILFGDMYESLGIDFAEKYKALKIANTPFINALALLGLVFLVASKKPSHAQVSITLSILFFLYFLPEFSFYKLHQQLKPLTSIALAFAMNKIYELINLVPRLGKWLKFLYMVTMMVIVGTSLGPTYYSAFSFIPVEKSPGLVYQDILAEYEYDVAFWLKYEMPSNLVIISDHHTMRYLAALANKPYVGYREMRPHALYWFQRVYQQLQQIRRAIIGNSSIEVYLTIINFDPIMYYEKPYLQATGRSIENATYVIVITPRTTRWLDGGVPYFPVAGTVNKNYLTAFSDNKFFIPRYNLSDKVYIFEVRKTDFWYSYKRGQIPTSFIGYADSSFAGWRAVHGHLIPRERGASFVMLENATIGWIEVSGLHMDSQFIRDYPFLMFRANSFGGNIMYVDFYNPHSKHIGRLWVKARTTESQTFILNLRDLNLPPDDYIWRIALVFRSVNDLKTFQINWIAILDIA